MSEKNKVLAYGLFGLVVGAIMGFAISIIA